MHDSVVTVPVERSARLKQGLGGIKVPEERRIYQIRDCKELSCILEELSAERALLSNIPNIGLEQNIVCTCPVILHLTTISQSLRNLQANLRVVLCVYPSSCLTVETGDAMYIPHRSNILILTLL
jgi:hypothetical protein